MSELMGRDEGWRTYSILAAFVVASILPTVCSMAVVNRPLPSGTVARPTGLENVLHERNSLMADDLSKRAPQDASRINLNEDYEVKFWTQELGITADELRRVVQKHGNSAAKVRAALGKA